MTINVGDTYIRKSNHRTVKILVISNKLGKVVVEYEDSGETYAWDQNILLEYFSLVKKTLWLNINNNSIGCWSYGYNSKDTADKMSLIDTRIACVKVEYEEGQFDD